MRDDIIRMAQEAGFHAWSMVPEFARAIEAAHGIKGEA